MFSLSGDKLGGLGACSPKKNLDFVRLLLVQCWEERERGAQPAAKHRNVVEALTFAHLVTQLHSRRNNGNCK